MLRMPSHLEWPRAAFEGSGCKYVQRILRYVFYFPSASSKKSGSDEKNFHVIRFDQLGLDAHLL